MSSAKAKIPLLEAAKWIIFILLAVFIYSISAQGRESAADFSVVSEAVTTKTDISILQEADNQMAKRLYGLDPSQYEGFLLYTPTTNMGSEELLIVKLADISQQEAVVAAIESRIATQMDSFEGYAQTQYEMLQNAVVEVQGNYILFISAADPAPARQAFLGAL